MKNYLLVLISAILLFPIMGCKKKSFDPTTKSREDFIGTWKGTISTFKYNKLLKEYGTIMIYPGESGTSLTGIIFMKETNIFHEFQFVNGTLYFNVENSDPANPFCQNWSLGGYAIFSEEGKIDIKITGNECGDVGTEYVNWVGTMAQTLVSADSLESNHFAKTGNNWIYKVTRKNGDSCQVQKSIVISASNYLNTGATTQSCGWNGISLAFKWSVPPSGFTVINDSTLCNRQFTFPINAKPGVVYSNFGTSDTTTVSLVDTNIVVATPAGTFMCNKFRYTEPARSGLTSVTRTAYIWLNNAYGIIRQEVVNPVDSTDIQLQVLYSKNF
ncbi:MAG: hypothetical protein ACOYNC_07725 [Bacteroidales bacterium]